MNKQIVLAALAAIACSAVLAQAPAGTGSRPTAEMNPAASGGAAAANAQNKVDTRTNQSSTMPASQTAGSGGAAPASQIDPSASGGKAAASADARTNARLMDTNGDGMVSRKEWDAYHAKAWNMMKPKNTGVSTADIDKLNRTPATN